MSLCFSAAKRKFPKISHFIYYNPKDSMISQTDASKKGLGAVLIQNSTPVMFASRALTGSKRKCQNLEQEWLDYNMGHGKVPLLSLWKGLYFGDRPKATTVTIYRKHMVEISPRMQRLVVRSFPYQPFNLQIQERCGKSTSRCSQ